jgi:hypothetical protein
VAALLTSGAAATYTEELGEGSILPWRRNFWRKGMGADARRRLRVRGRERRRSSCWFAKNGEEGGDRLYSGVGNHGRARGALARAARAAGGRRRR